MSDASQASTPDRTTRRIGRDVRVLVVDDDATVLATMRQLLEHCGMTVLTAESTAEALRVVSSARIDVALLDWCLTGHDDGLALGRGLARECGMPFVLFSGYLTTDVTVQALRLGAADVVDKPIRPGRLLAAIEFALHQGPGVNAPAESVPVNATAPDAGSVSRRWAAVVLSACRAAKDPRTESAVARASAMSLSVYREICRLCDVGGRNTRDLVRFLRALSRAQEDGSTLLSHLAIADSRTADRLFEGAGVSIEGRFIPLRSFLLHQKFIPCEKECLRELAHVAANDSLFFIDVDRSEKQLR